MTEDSQDKIKVSDRRTAATDEGDTSGNGLRDTTAAQREAGEQAYSEVAGSCEEAESPDRFLPPVDFSTLVLSFAQSALVHLGEIEDPDTGRPTRDLTLARHNIDLLGMLQEKTRGNLDQEEQNLLENLLYDLRMKYVSQCQGG